MKLKQEINNLLKKEVPMIVRKKLLPRITTFSDTRTNKLLKKLTTLDWENNRKVQRTHDRIYTDIISQTIRELINHQYGKRDEEGFRK